MRTCQNHPAPFYQRAAEAISHESPSREATRTQNNIAMLGFTERTCPSSNLNFSSVARSMF
jgi:hypothetical protein